MNNQNERIALAMMDTDDALHDMEATILKVFKDNPDNKYTKDGIRLLTGVSKNIADYRVGTLCDKGLIKTVEKEALPGCNITSQYQFVKNPNKTYSIINGPWV